MRHVKTQKQGRKRSRLGKIKTGMYRVKYPVLKFDDSIFSTTSNFLSSFCKSVGRYLLKVHNAVKNSSSDPKTKLPFVTHLTSRSFSS